jgi:hypothetical protein
VSSSLAPRKGAPTPPGKRHAFDVDQADHCETPFRAYQDILPVLDQIAKSCGKERQNLIIYDPYYCDGGIISKLKSLGCPNVINHNRDFYHDIATGRVPPFDVLLTNPPYSGDHIESLLKFVSRHFAIRINSQGSKKPNRTLTPFLLLLPHYVYTKPYFQEYFDSDARGREGQRAVATTVNNRQMFYLVPKNNYRYAYEPPSWVNLQTGSTALAKGKTQTAPFPTFWYCHVPSLMVMKTTEKTTPHQQSWLCQTFGLSGKHHVLSKTPAAGPAVHHSRLLYANCTVNLPREFKGEFDVTNKRPNPRARKRAAVKKVQQHPSEQTQNLQRTTKSQAVHSSTGGNRKKRRY